MVCEFNINRSIDCQLIGASVIRLSSDMVDRLLNPDSRNQIVNPSTSTNIEVLLPLLEV